MTCLPGRYPGAAVLPPVDGGVALSEPADPREFVFLTSGTKIHDHVVFCDHQLQSPDHVPASASGSVLAHIHRFWTVTNERRREVQLLVLTGSDLLNPPGTGSVVPEQVIHDILVVLQTVLWQVTGGKHDDVIHTVSIVAWEREWDRVSQVFNRGRGHRSPHR